MFRVQQSAGPKPVYLKEVAWKQNIKNKMKMKASMKGRIMYQKKKLRFHRDPYLEKEGENHIRNKTINSRLYQTTPANTKKEKVNKLKLVEVSNGPKKRY